MPDGYTAEAASPAPHMRRNVGLLIACQALFYTATGVILAVSALVGFALAPAGEKWLATAPQAIQWLTTAAFALPVALLMRRFGRKAIFVAFSLLGALGTLGATGAIVWHEFWVFVVATLAFGAFNAAGQHLRFAAAEVASDAFRAVAISLVVGGGVIGAFAGPEIAKWTHAIAADWLRHDGVAALVAWLGPADAAGGGAHPYQFAGTFLALVAVPLILIAVVALVRFPPPPAVAVQTEPAQPLLEMVVQPGFVVAVLCAVIGWGIMVFMMSATPLAMIAEHGHGTDHAMFVTQWHMVGMFAPSLVTGTLIRRHGLLNVLLCGLVLTVGAAVTGMLGGSTLHFLAANIFVGVGWNFLFVGGTTLLTFCSRPSERTVAQGFNDLLVFGAVAVFSIAAGWVQTSAGWLMVCVLMVPFVAAAFVAVLWLKVTAGAAPAGVADGRPALPSAAE